MEDMRFCPACRRPVSSLDTPTLESAETSAAKTIAIRLALASASG